jgi:tetratricopeptide (TPR) repeat protein
MLVGCGRAEKQKARVAARAETYFRAQEYDKAKIEYLNLLRLDRNNPDPRAIQQLARIWFEEGAPLEAYPYLSMARELVPNDFELRSKLATILANLGEADLAKKEANAILEQSPNDKEALLVLTQTAQNDEEYDQVQRQLRLLSESDEVTYHVGFANLATRTGDLAYAQAELEEAVKLQPKSARLHLALANILSQRQDTTKAEQEFQTAVALSPVRSGARMQYAQFEAAVGKAAEADSILREITQQAPDYFPAWCALAETAISQMKFQEALILLEKVLSRDPQNLNALLLQAEAWLGQGDTKKAISFLEQLSIVYPLVPIINYHLAEAYLAGNNSVQAASALKDAIAMKPDYTEAILLLAQIDLHEGNPALVVPVVTKVLRNHPGLTSASLLLADAYRLQRRLDDAVAALREQLQTTPGSAEVYFRLGALLLEQDKIDEARDAFEQAEQFSPGDPQPIEQLVQIGIDTHDFNFARSKVELLLKENPNSSEAFFLSAKIDAGQNQIESACKNLKRALELNPKFERAVDLLASIYVNNNQLDQAIGELNSFLARNPLSIVALTRLAFIYNDLKDYPRARDAYEKLLSITPDSAGTLNNLAYLYAEHLDDAPRACQLARKARALQPRDPSIADTLGWALYQNGDYGEALWLLRESVQKLSGNSDVQFHLGTASYMMEDVDLARTAFRNALSANGDSPHRAEAQHRLEFLDRHDWSVEQLERVLQDEPENAVALSRLGKLLESRSLFVKSATVYEQLLQVNSESLTAALKLAQLYDGPLNDYDMAFAYAKRARDLAPNDGQVAAVLATVAYHLGNFPWADSLFQESSRKITGGPVFLSDYAFCSYLVGNVGEARRLMQRALESHPDSKLEERAKSFLRLTAIDEELDQVNTAQVGPEVEKVLQNDPNNVPAMVAMARIQTARRDFKSAISVYVDLLRKYPDFALAQKYLAILYAEDDANLNEAFGLAMKARSVFLDDPDLSRALGQIAYKREDYTYAVECFRDRARKKPLTAVDFYYLGMAQLHLSKDAESKESLQKALSGGLKEPLLQQAQTVLAELQNRSGL